MFANEHTNNPQARRYRAIMRIVAKTQGDAAKSRAEAAQEKRARKAEKRLRDAHRAELGQMVAAERLVDGLPR